MKTQLPFIYICSLMRTGSTMLQELLMEPGKAFIFHEPWLGSGLFENQKLAHEILGEWGVDIDRVFYDGIPSSLMFLKLSKRIPQLGVKEIRHYGWEMYLNLFDDIRFLLLGRDPRDIFVSTYHFRQNWHGWWSPYDTFSVENLFKELDEDFQRQLRIYQTQQNVMQVRYEDLCIKPETLSEIKKFTQSPVEKGIVGNIHERLERNKHEKQHGGKVNREQIGRYEREEDPIVKLEADAFYDKMTEYRDFWGY